MKKLFAIILAFALVFGVSASTVQAQGMGSLALAVDFTYVDITNFNCGMVINLSESKANSGFNFVGGKEASITTGDAQAETEATTGLNSSSTAGMLTDSQSGPIAVNFNSGLNGFGANVLPMPYLGPFGWIFMYNPIVLPMPYLDPLPYLGPFGWLFMYNPIAIAADIKYVDIDNFNGGFVLNDSLADANTGFNVALGKKASITSGNATASTNSTTNLNSNTTYVELYDTGLVGPVAANVDFDYGLGGLGGPGSLALAVEADIVLVDNVNLGAVMNFSGAYANTGWNTAGKKGTITSGNATASTETTTTMNTNATGVVIADTGLIGPVAANVDFDFMDVGAGCLPWGDMAIALDVNLVSVDNFNFGAVMNFSEAYANTGFNVAGKKSNITTGAAVASTTTTSNVNSNTTGVVIADYSSGPIAGNVDIDLYPFCADWVGAPCIGGVGPIAANVNTNGGVAIAVDANLAFVDNTNIAMVVNTSTAVANSGMNTTGKEGTITTGTAAASTATTNTVNTNETGIVITDGSGVGPVAANIESGNSTSIAAEVTVADVDNTNEAEVINVSIADANTGGNTSSGQPCGPCCGSSDGGSVTTGAATASTETTNNVNTNTTTFVINQ